MDELVQQIVEKTGLSEDMARKVADVVIDHLKEKLPDSLAQQVEGLLKGGSPDMGDMLKKGLGGLLG